MNFALKRGNGTAQWLFNWLVTQEVCVSISAVSNLFCWVKTKSNQKSGFQVTCQEEVSEEECLIFYFWWVSPKNLKTASATKQYQSDLEMYGMNWTPHSKHQSAISIITGNDLVEEGAHFLNMLTRGTIKKFIVYFCGNICQIRIQKKL
jgi:hypothetical protein